jgi:hypothetical protein
MHAAGSRSSLFCLHSAGMHLQPLPGSVALPFGNVSLFVYSKGDIVSDLLAKNSAWESHEVQQVLWALHAAADPAHARAAAVVRSQRARALGAAASAAAAAPWPPLMVDVGANVGWVRALACCLVVCLRMLACCLVVCLRMLACCLVVCLRMLACCLVVCLLITS